MEKAQPFDILAGKGNLKSYLMGFFHAAFLTALAFASAALARIPAYFSLPVMFVLALAQILIHLRYFLHLDSSAIERLNVLTLIFTVLVLIVFVGGALWVIVDLDYRLM